MSIDINWQELYAINHSKIKKDFMSELDSQKLKVKFQNLYKEYSYYSNIFKIDLLDKFETRYNELDVTGKFGKLTPLGHMVYKYEFMKLYLISLKDLLFTERNETGEQH